MDNSDSKNGKKEFSYVFVGDLYEDITSNYAIDYAMIPLILDQSNILLRDKDNVLGFFTFSDRLESQLKCTPEKMTSILSFFKRIEKVDVDDFYCPEYKNISGLKLKKIACPMGPFSRNYIVVTPGDENSVLNMTSQIFAERIFYELYYLLNKYKEKANQVQAIRTEKSRNCFSSFTMAQISRLDQLQVYYLTYCLEYLVTDYLLRDEVKGINLDALENKFLSMLDIIERRKESSYKRDSNGYKVNFPIERAVSLFINKFRNELKGLVPSYITQEFKDEKEYVEICKSRINEKLYDLQPYYDDFVKEEIRHMHGELEKGYVNLFKVDKLTGNIQYYIRYINDLKNIFESWTGDLQDQLNSLEEIDLSKNYEKVQQKIKKYQKSFIYKLPFFRPVRKMLINNAILELPLKQYLEREIKRNLLESFLKQWEDKSPNSVSPVRNCDVLVQDLKIMKDSLQKKRKMIEHKKEFISTMPTHYYIISQFKQKEYTDLLNKNYDKNFGPVNQMLIENVARDLFKKWTIKGEGIAKDRHDITKDPSGFIRHVDTYLFEEAKKIFANVDVDYKEYEKYAATSVQMLEERVKQLSQNSFITEDETFFITDNKVLFQPVLQQEDYIDTRLGDLPTSTHRLQVNKDFTLGAVVYFQDYMYMEYKNLCHYEDLFKKYESETPEPLIYAEPGTISEDDEPILFSDFVSSEEKNIASSDDIIDEDVEMKAESCDVQQPQAVDEIIGTTNEKPLGISTNVDDDELNLFNLHSRMLLNDFFDENYRLQLFTDIFGESVSALTAANINAIAKNVDISDLLQKMEIEQLHNYCNVINLEDIFTDKETQIEVILNYLETASE
ncbi:MAG: hypothetical protein HUK25_02400 [Treponema sp.]|nr:hypothetical protein [Treponema sp.]